jgi:hypothetical protein
MWSPYAGLGALALAFRRHSRASVVILTGTLLGFPWIFLATDGCAFLGLAFWGWFAVAIVGVVADRLRR